MITALALPIRDYGNAYVRFDTLTREALSFHHAADFLAYVKALQAANEELGNAHAVVDQLSASLSVDPIQPLNLRISILCTRMWELLQEAEDHYVVHEIGCTAYTDPDCRCSCGCDVWLAKKEKIRPCPS